MKTRFFNFNLDFIGFITSIVCVIHCMFVSVILIFSTLSSIFISKNHLIEIIIIAFSAIIAIFSLIPSYFKYHKRIDPILMVIIGFLCIGIAHTWEELWFCKLSLMPIGGLSIAIGHWKNRRLTKQKINKIH